MKIQKRLNGKLFFVITIAIAVSFVVILSASGVLYIQNATDQVFKPPTIYLSGNVEISEVGVNPNQIMFTSEKLRCSYIADATIGTYCISLPNEDTYTVSITWISTNNTCGTIGAGRLYLNSLDLTRTENWNG